MTLEKILISGLCLAFGSLVQSVLGFGMGVVAIPLLVWGGLTLPQAISMVLPGVFVQTSLNCWQNRQFLSWPEARWMFCLRMTGLPLGILMLKWVSGAGQDLTRQLLGVGVIGILLIQQAYPRTSPKPVGPAGTVLTGLISGFFAGLIGMGGPPLVIWVLRQNWDGRRQRCFMWLTFLLITPVQMSIMLFTFAQPLGAAMLVGLGCLPVVILVAWCGAQWGNKLSKTWLTRLMQLFLLLIALRLGLSRWL